MVVTHCECVKRFSLPAHHLWFGLDAVMGRRSALDAKASVPARPSRPRANLKCGSRKPHCRHSCFQL
jgi:hypothetical protein